MEEEIQEVQEQDQQDVSAQRAAFAKELYGDAIPEIERPDETEAVNPEPKDDDPWSGLPAAVRQHIEGLTAKVSEFDKLAYRTQQAERRIGSLQNELHQAKIAAEKVKEAPTAADIAKAAADDESWGAFVEEWPEAGKAFNSKFTAQRAEIEKQAKTIEALRGELSGLTGAAEQKLVEKIKPLETRLNYSIIKIDHNDLDKILDENNGFKVFEPWRLKNQTKDDDLNDPVGASKFLKRFKESDEYKTWAGIKPKQTAREIQEANQQRLRNAETIPGRQPPPMRTEADLSDRERRAKAAARLWPDLPKGR